MILPPTDRLLLKLFFAILQENAQSTQLLMLDTNALIRHPPQSGWAPDLDHGIVSH